MLKRIIVAWILPPSIYGLLRRAEALFRNLLSIGYGATERGSRSFADVDNLIAHHFSGLGAKEHINRAGLTLALRRLNEKPALIVETGSSAWGTDSTRLFASYVRSFGGRVISVDIRPEPSQQLSDVSGVVSFFVDDSVNFLNSFQLPDGFGKIDLLYLDSWDLDLANPSLAMEHGLAEWKSAQRFLASGSLVVIDDTPIEGCLLGDPGVAIHQKYGFVPGKGALVLKDADALNDYSVPYHHYNVVLAKR